MLSSDVIIERAFVVGNQTPNAEELGRADAAPRDIHGDGSLTAADTIQVRRYVAGLDPPEMAGTFEALRPLYDQWNKANTYLKSLWTDRTVSAVQAEKSPAGKVVLYVEMNSSGDEAAAAFTLRFDQTKLTNPIISLASGAGAGTTLTTNTTRSSEGQLAILLDTNETLAGGQIVSITFDVIPNDAGGTTDVSFTDAITQRSVADTRGNLLPARFVDATIDF